MVDPLLDAEYPKKMQQILDRTLFEHRDAAFFETDAYRTTVNDNVHRRYAVFKNHIVPWITAVKNLQESLILEVGCGTGCCASAFSPVVKQVIGFDISRESVQAFEGRMQILQITNCNAVPEAFNAKSFESVSSKRPDAILLMATLEHMTFEERIDIIRTSWNLLADDGVLAVADTPNRLSPVDYHTSDLPFYHWLSDDVRCHYASESPRPHFAKLNMASLEKTPEIRKRGLQRAGIGVSYHDFEIAIGKSVHSFVVADGSEKVVSQLVGTRFEDSLINLLFDHYKIAAHRCFARRTLQFILQKRSRVKN